MTEYRPQSPSIGGEVADFTGTISEMSGGEKHYSFNPDGNPYEGKTPEEMINRFVGMFPDDLNLLSNALTNVFADKEEKPQIYNEAMKIIQEKMDNKSSSS